MNRRNLYFTFIVAVLILVLLYLSGYIKKPDSESIIINSLEELENHPQIISAKKLNASDINFAYISAGHGRQDESRFDNLVVYEILYNSSDGAEVMGIIAAPADYLKILIPLQ